MLPTLPRSAKHFVAGPDYYIWRNESLIQITYAFLFFQFVCRFVDSWPPDSLLQFQQNHGPDGSEMSILYVDCLKLLCILLVRIAATDKIVKSPQTVRSVNYEGINPQFTPYHWTLYHCLWFQTSLCFVPMASLCWWKTISHVPVNLDHGCRNKGVQLASGVTKDNPNPASTAALAVANVSEKSHSKHVRPCFQSPIVATFHRQSATVNRGCVGSTSTGRPMLATNYSTRESEETRTVSWTTNSANTCVGGPESHRFHCRAIWN